MTRTYIVEVPDNMATWFESEIQEHSFGKIVGHTDSVCFLDMIDFPVPTNYGTWDKDDKFHGGTNYSGEATRYALTIESKEK